LKRKPIQILLVIAISVFVLVSLVYSQYYILASADFISVDLKLENFDQEYLSAADQSAMKVYGAGGSFEGYQPFTCLSGQSFPLLSRQSSLDQKTSPLRC
jgi:hypothetical protein